MSEKISLDSSVSLYLYILHLLSQMRCKSTIVQGFKQCKIV